MTVEQFVRDGYIVVRDAFDPDIAAACRDLIWDAFAAEGVSRDPATWTRPGEPFVAAATSPLLCAAYDELIGSGRWTPRRDVGGTILVPAGEEGMPSEQSITRVRPSVLCPPRWIRVADQPC